MQTKFDVGNKVYFLENMHKVGITEIKNGKITSIKIRGTEDINYKIKYYRNYINEYECFKEARCFSTFEEARQQLIKDVIAKYQQDMEKVLGFKEVE